MSLNEEQVAALERILDYLDFLEGRDFFTNLEEFKGQDFQSLEVLAEFRHMIERHVYISAMELNIMLFALGGDSEGALEFFDNFNEKVREASGYEDFNLRDYSDLGKIMGA